MELSILILFLLSFFECNYLLSEIAMFRSSSSAISDSIAWSFLKYRFISLILDSSMYRMNLH